MLQNRLVHAVDSDQIYCLLFHHFEPLRTNLIREDNSIYEKREIEWRLNKFQTRSQLGIHRSLETPT